MTRETRRRFTLTALLCALVAVGVGVGVVSCGKRERIPTAIDGAVKLDSRPLPPVKLDTGVRWDTGGVILPDLFVPPPPDQGQPGPSNSGAVCSQSAGCAHNGEACMVMETGATMGMCLGMCDTTGADCPVPNPATQFSKCVLKAKNGQLHCAWFCEVQGKSYQCPNNTGYKCVALDPNQPFVKFCLPK